STESINKNKIAHQNFSNAKISQNSALKLDHVRNLLEEPNSAQT
ncbi:20805_t:CDS:1, partial [Racocetra persica]